MTRKFDFRQLLPVARIGIVGGTIVRLLGISKALLIFSGELASFAPRASD